MGVSWKGGKERVDVSGFVFFGELNLNEQEHGKQRETGPFFCVLFSCSGFGFSFFFFLSLEVTDIPGCAPITPLMELSRGKPAALSLSRGGKRERTGSGRELDFL